VKMYLEKKKIAAPQLKTMFRHDPFYGLYALLGRNVVAVYHVQGTLDNCCVHNL
jgi:hypothetical protein